MRKHFDFYGYNGPTSGKYFVDGCEYFSGEDFRNKKRFKEYKDIGFNILLLQHENSYSGEEFETSACNLCMTEAVKAGINRIIVSDTRLKDLCIEENLIGENGKFKTEKEFLEYLDFCTAPYRNQKGFYGVQLFDEPLFEHLDNYGAVCKGLRKVIPNIYLQCNLNPPASLHVFKGRGKSIPESFEEYLRLYIEKSNEDNILFDEYPFSRDYIIHGYGIRSYQIAARVCKELGKEFRLVLQSWAYMWGEIGKRAQISPRSLVKEDMYWQLNMLMGMGCKEYSFFTYFTKQNVSLIEKINLTVDGSSLVNRDGTRTKLYFIVQKIIKEMKNFENVILKYSYDNNWFFFEQGKTYKDFMQTELSEINNNCPIEVVPKKELAYVTRLTSEKSEMFMVQNIENLKTQYERKEPIEFAIDLKKPCKKVNVYFKGKKIKRKIINGKFTEKLYCGDAIFIEIIH